MASVESFWLILRSKISMVCCLMKKKTMVELQRISVQEFKKARKMPLVVVLDDVRSEMNVGSVFRTADAFAVDKLCLCGITPVPPMPEIHKTALGAEDSVEWQHYNSVIQCIEDLRSAGYIICSVEQVHGSVSLENFVLGGENNKYAVIFGNEVKGVSQEAVDCSDCCLELPQRGTKHSLNIANTASIVMWHFFRNIMLS